MRGIGITRWYEKLQLYIYIKIRKICLLTEGLRNQAVKPLSMEHHKEKFNVNYERNWYH